MEATPISTGAGREDDIAASGTSHDDAPLVAFIDSILQEAIQHGASDIHFEPYAEHLRIRLRIDGMLHDVAHPPVSMRSRIAARLKVMAHLDISERRLPQDGAIKWRHLGGPGIDFRVSTLPRCMAKKSCYACSIPPRHTGISTSSASPRCKGGSTNPPCPRHRA